MIVDITTLDAATIERAVKRAEERKPSIRNVRYSPGWVSAEVECGRTCGHHAFNDGWHDPAISHTGAASCGCMATVGLCYHLAALIAHEGGTLPLAPALADPTIPYDLRDPRREKFDPVRHAPWATLDFEAPDEPAPYRRADGIWIESLTYYPITGDTPVTTYGAYRRDRSAYSVGATPDEAVAKLEPLAAPTVPSRPAARPASSPARSRESSGPAARDTTPGEAP